MNKGELVNWEIEPNDIDWPTNFEEHSRDFVRSPLCYLNVHHLTPLQLMGFADDAYHKKDDDSKKVFKKLFLHEYENNIAIKELTNDTNDAMMFRYDITIPNAKKVTIFSIRGSTTWLDWWLDIQIYCSSLFLSLSRQFAPFVNRIDSFSYTEVSNLITWPIKGFYKSTIIEKYLSKLESLYKDEEAKGDMGTVIFVGHSLAGGLAKLMGKKFKKTVFSLSGPGITVFNGIFEPDKYNLNFPTTFIDVTPDMDMVPRIEKSGGTTFRIPCEKGLGTCHSTAHSICMTSIMCGYNNTLYCNKYGVFKKNVDNQIKDMEKLVNFDENSNKDFGKIRGGTVTVGMLMLVFIFSIVLCYQKTSPPPSHNPLNTIEDTTPTKKSDSGEGNELEDTSEDND